LTNTGKKIGVSIALLVPAIVVAGGLLYILLAIDYGPGPSIEVGAIFCGTWALFYGYYFKFLRFKQVGALLTVVGVASIYVNLGSLSEERYDSQESSAFIALESQRSMAVSPSKLDVLNAAAARINSTLPMMTDSNIRLNSAVALADRFQYNYTLSSRSSVEVEEVSFLQQVNAAIASDACGLEDNLSFLKMGVIIDFIYKANDGITVTIISVAPEDCGL
jgi:hypothetical protein